ncbi:MAG: hypothetical protein ABIK96_17610 [bacterium]
MKDSSWGILLGNVIVGLISGMIHLIAPRLDLTLKPRATLGIYLVLLGPALAVAGGIDVDRSVMAAQLVVTLVGVILIVTGVAKKSPSVGAEGGSSASAGS